jgi:hypothetical protein
LSKAEQGQQVEQCGTSLIGKVATNTVALYPPYPMPVRQSLHNFLKHGAFITAFSIEK